VRSLLLDSSVWLAAARETDEPEHAAATALVRRRTQHEVELRLLDLTIYELGNVTICKWKLGTDRAGRVVERALQLAGTAPLVPTPEERRSALALAEEHGLSVYDATYGAVARARRLTLVSGDLRLQDAGLAVAPATVA
jgi:predicted nucleic acid-binding protein